MAPGTRTRPRSKEGRGSRRSCRALTPPSQCPPKIHISVIVLFPLQSPRRPRALLWWQNGGPVAVTHPGTGSRAGRAAPKPLRTPPWPGLWPLPTRGIVWGIKNHGANPPGKQLQHGQEEREGREKESGFVTRKSEQPFLGEDGFGGQGCCPSAQTHPQCWLQGWAPTGTGGMGTLE